MSERKQSTVALAARLGFSHASHAAVLLERLREGFPAVADELIAELARCDDPQLGLAALVDLWDQNPTLVQEIVADPDWRARLIVVLGGSEALGAALVKRPHLAFELATVPMRRSAAELRAAVLVAVGAPELAELPRAELAMATIATPEAPDLLRWANQAQLVRIAARDLGAPDPLEALSDVAAELSDLADAIIATALAIARGQVPHQELVRIGVVALGKCGAQELNYVSDVDVLYVAEPAQSDLAPAEVTAIGTKIVAALARICSAHTAAGTIWQVDAALRPEGDAGPLVRSLAAMRSYYQKWASPWEFQALLKARPMAGDLDLGDEFCELVAPLVWQVGEQNDFIAAARSMRERVVALIPSDQSDREIKLCAGGLRDVEFSVQLLQLVHGRADERLRVRATLAGLHALVSHGYVGRADGELLGAAYRFERCLEHRIQLFHLRRTHLLPSADTDLVRLARSLRLPGVSELREKWRSTTHQVQRLQRRVFFSPLLEAVARIPSAELGLSSEAAYDRLRALGFVDPDAALRHIEALTQGVSRTVEIQRQLMPAMLNWFAEGPNPDAGLLAFRQLSEAVGSSSWYLGALRDQAGAAERLAKILSSSRYITELLRRDPPSVQFLNDAGALRPRERETLLDAMRRAADRYPDSGAAIHAVRGLRRRELFRIAVSDVVGVLDLAGVGAALSDLASATIDAAIQICSREHPHAPPIGVVAMGRWGGAELGYPSDADALFVVADDVDPAALEAAIKVVTRVRATLTAPGPEPPLELDVDLRPEGRDGVLVRSVSSYLKYYARWSVTWETQALLRASYGAGDPECVAALLTGIAALRWPVAGITEADLRAIQKLKSRMETERIKRGDPSRNLKLGQGGLSDVEWTVQLLQLQHAGELAPLRTTSTGAALTAIQDAGLLNNSEVGALRCAWEFASRIRNAVMLVRGRPSDTLPSDAREVAAVALLVGYRQGEASRLLDDWARVARRAHRVVETHFWGSQ